MYSEIHYVLLAILIKPHIDIRNIVYRLLTFQLDTFQCGPLSDR